MEVIWLRLRGAMAAAPASLVLPLALSDLPVFLRWRGEPPFGAPHFEQLVDIADRLVVDSSEWDELRYAELASLMVVPSPPADYACCVAARDPARGSSATGVGE